MICFSGFLRFQKAEFFLPQSAEFGGSFDRIGMGAEFHKFTVHRHDDADSGIRMRKPELFDALSGEGCGNFMLNGAEFGKKRGGLGRRKIFLMQNAEHMAE